MIAELYGKISKDYSNLSERLEDNLTGNIFGTLRYLNRQNLGLANLIKSISILDDRLKNELLKSVENEKSPKYVFWKKYKDFGEIDLLIEGEFFMVGIEVKYLSGLSSDDDIRNDDSEIINISDNQLSRYSRMMNELNKHKRKYLIFLAPRSIADIAYSNILSRNIIDNEITFCYATWENFLNQLETIEELSLFSHEKIIIEDVIQYLKYKGFDSFRGFNFKEYVCIQKSFYSFKQNTKLRYDYSEEKIDKGVYYEYR